MRLLTIEKLVVLKFNEEVAIPEAQCFTDTIRKYLETDGTTKVIGIPNHIVTLDCYGINSDEYTIDSIAVDELLKIVKNKENIL